MQLLRKISARTVYGSKGAVLEAVFKDKTKPHPLYRIVGICTGTRTGQSIEGETDGAIKRKPQPGDKMRDWTALLGNFEAVNALTGEVFRSGVCFLPNYVADLVAGQLTGDVDNVRFAFDITAQYAEESATSYVYAATPLIAPKPDDPLAILTGSIPAMLAAPAKAG
jgi:hypothetical protein